ncbi:MAG TPA: hypothetical protein V6C97_26880 [Oculatellaceae cyanobacterium]
MSFPRTAIVISATLLAFNFFALGAWAGKTEQAPVDPFINYMDKAKTAEVDNKLDVAKTQYMVALSIAKQRGKIADQVHVLESLARLELIRPNITEAEPYYEAALKLTKEARQRPNFDREALVWMSDLADAYYVASQRTFDNEIKAYCVWRYSMIHLAFDSRAIQEVFGNISRLAVYFCMMGKYHEAEALCAPRVSIYERTPGHDPVQLGQTWLILATVQVGAHEPERAKASYANASKLMHLSGSSLIERQLGNLALYQNQFDQSRAFFGNCLKADQPTVRPNPTAALDCYFIGLSYVQEKKDELAEKFLSQSIAYQSANSVLRLFPYEQLAIIYERQGKKQMRDRCLKMVQEIRSANSECQKTTPAQQKDYYMIWGSMPNPMEVSNTTGI